MYQSLFMYNSQHCTAPLARDCDVSVCRLVTNAHSPINAIRAIADEWTDPKRAFTQPLHAFSCYATNM
jgi:hypothetical protein